MLVCMPAADVPLEGSSPSAFDHVYEANACQPSDRRFSTAITSPLYLSEYASELVNRKRRAEAGVTAVSNRNTVTLLRRPASDCPRRTCRRHPSTR